MAIVCALICRRVLYTELSSKFGLASWVARRADRMAGKSFARKTTVGRAKLEVGELKR